MKTLYILFEIFFNIKPEDFKAKNTPMPVDEKRHMLIYFMSFKLKMKSTEIARELKRESHACVNNSLKKFDDLVFSDKKYKSDYELIDILL